MDLKYKKEIERIEKIKEDYEAGNITEKDIEDEDVELLNLMYNFEIEELELKIKQARAQLDDYKKRMKEAIEYLKHKNALN